MTLCWLAGVRSRMYVHCSFSGKDFWKAFQTNCDVCKTSLITGDHGQVSIPGGRGGKVVQGEEAGQQVFFD